MSGRRTLPQWASSKLESEISKGEGRLNVHHFSERPKSGSRSSILLSEFMKSLELDS